MFAQKGRCLVARDMEELWLATLPFASERLPLAAACSMLVPGLDASHVEGLEELARIAVS